MPFLSDPRPERICEFDPDHPANMLSVGLQVIAHSPSGLPIIPQTEVVFALGKTPGDPEERAFAVPPSMARTLAARLIEFCDAAERK